MHTGISTGLVVTGEVNLGKGTYGVLGDTINTASRLSGLAKPGEILVGSDTYYQAEGYFTFEPLEHAQVKGKAEPVRPYKVLSPREEPIKTRRLSGLRAELIGRRAEITILNQGIGKLKAGKGSIISISGDAGTGKSRLIEEFRTTPHAQEIQWREGHCYAYAQNIPYFPLIDLFSRAWQHRTAPRHAWFMHRCAEIATASSSTRPTRCCGTRLAGLMHRCSASATRTARWCAP